MMIYDAGVAPMGRDAELLELAQELIFWSNVLLERLNYRWERFVVLRGSNISEKSRRPSTTGKIESGEASGSSCKA
jgi:hypothetical protein